jgi:hypothetical protein
VIPPPGSEGMFQGGMAEVTRSRSRTSMAICGGRGVGGVKGEGGSLPRMCCRGSSPMILAGKTHIPPFSLYKEVAPLTCSFSRGATGRALDPADLLRERRGPARWYTSGFRDTGTITLVERRPPCSGDGRKAENADFDTGTCGRRS